MLSFLDCLTLFKSVLNKLSNSLFINRINDLSRHKTSFILSLFNSDDYGLFSLGTSSPFPRTFATHHSIIHLNEILQSINTISVRHRCSNFFKHISCDWPGNTNVLCQPQSRYAFLVSRHQIDSPKPLYQRQIRGMKQNACGQGNMIFTPKLSDSYQNQGSAA